MRVALLTAKPNWRRRVGGHRFSVSEKRPPHGLGFLYAILRQAGHQVDVFDRYCGNTAWPSDDWASYDFLGLYTASVCSTDIDRITRKARAARIAVGGPHAHLFPDQISGRVHHVVRGEAEKIIVDLVEGRITQRIVTPERLTSRDLDQLPRFPWELFWQRHRDLYDWGFIYDPVTPVFAMNTSRGCPYACSFCSVRRIWGRKLTAMSVDRVLDDVHHVRSLGARAIFFREDIFTSNHGRLVDLCQRMIAEGTKTPWACETRVDTVDAETMELMRRAGCIGFWVGVEHLTQRMLDIFNKRVTVDQILAFFENARRLGIFTHVSLIVDHPQETAEDRSERERLLGVIRPGAIVRSKYRADG